MNPHQRDAHRHCAVPGCQMWGRDLWMERHEASVHARCSCGWVGTRSSFATHTDDYRLRRHTLLGTVAMESTP